MIRCIRSALAVLGLLFLSGATSAREFHVYFGTYTGSRSEGIYRARFDAATGKLSDPELAAEIENPAFLALHPNRTNLYAVGEMKSGGSVSAFHVNPHSGRLTFLNRQSSGGRGPCHVSVDQTGRCVLVANYGGGSVAALSLRTNGWLEAASTVIAHRGRSVDPRRQNAPHAHFICPSPDNRFALTCDLGLDQVLVYELDPNAAGLQPLENAAASVTPGSGPRHLAFSPDERFVYVINELSGTVSAFQYEPDQPRMKWIHDVSSLPSGFTNQNTSSGIAIHPNGRFLYASNRGHDSIALFHIDTDSGRLTFVEHQTESLRTPRHFAIDPTGRWLLAENQDADTVLVFALDPDTGKLRATGQSIRVGSPVCAVFLEVF